MFMCTMAANFKEFIAKLVRFSIKIYKI